MIFSKLKPKGRALLFSSVLMSGVLVPAFVNAGSGQDFNSRIDVLEFQALELNNSLQAIGNSLTPPAIIGDQPLIRVAQSRGNASTNLRIAQMEEQMRTLTGQVEGLQFQLTQIQMLIERMQEDNEFRFQQLEGGGSGKTEAVTQSGGDRPIGELPQNQTLSAPIDSGAEDIVLAEGNGTDQSFGPVPSGEGLVEETGFEELGLEGQALDGQALDEQALDGQVFDGPALDFSFDPDSLVTNRDADAQYRAGFEAVLQGDYDFAQDQFRLFVELYPDHPQAPDATNWLGESLIINQEYNEAAQVLFAGFEKYQNTTRAPDLLFKLGVALVGAGEQETACRTFNEVLKRYPEMGEAFESEVSREMVQAQC